MASRGGLVVPVEFLRVLGLLEAVPVVRPFVSRKFVLAHPNASSLAFVSAMPVRFPDSSTITLLSSREHPAARGFNDSRILHNHPTKDIVDFGGATFRVLPNSNYARRLCHIDQR